MNYSYVAYIDESGDPGCTGPFRKRSTDGGQSNFLTLATYIVRTINDKHLVQIRDEIRNEIKPKWQKRDLHFKGLKHEQKIRYCQHLATQRTQIVAVIVNKAHLSKREAFSKNTKQLYWYACRLLVERISWLCDDARAGPDQRKVKLIFSDRGGTPCSEFKNYLKNMRGVNTQIRWQCIDEDLVESMSHSQRAGLQFADAVASSISWGVEPQQFGNTEPRYGQTLKPKIYKSKAGKIAGYGIKMLPNLEVGLSNEQRAYIQALCE